MNEHAKSGVERQISLIGKTHPEIDRQSEIDMC